MRSRRALVWVGFLLTVAATLWGMAALSAWLTREHLSARAANTWSALREGRPLWQWPLQRPEDLVARRVFGAVELARTPLGLRITSLDGSPFELGLPLPEPVDLAHWPLLQLRAHSTAPGTLHVRYQASESAPACQTDQPLPLLAGAQPAPLNLGELTWHSTQGAACQPPANVAYMLRLQIQVPAHTTLAVSQADLLAQQPQRLDKATTEIQLPLAADAQVPTSQRAPMVRLPADASSESMLLLRDYARQTWPGAPILPAGQLVTTTIRAALPPWVDWATLVLYLIFLVTLSWRHTREVQRPWLEVAAIAFGPLWLIAGLRWDAEPSIPGAMAFVAALAYGGLGEWRRRPVAWSWSARRPSDWLWPLVPLPVAAVLIALDGHALTRLPALHVAAYFAWALLQQWAMLALVMGRLRQTQLPMLAVMLITATLFGLLHTPNGALMQLCFLAELWWAWCFFRAPRLLPIAVAHALAALLVESGLTGHWLRSLEVSARFFL